MKLQILQEKFSKALLSASRFTSTRAQLPVLGNVLLSAKKNKLLIASTNLEMSIVIPIGAQVEKEGEITIPAKTITDLVNNLSSGAIDLSVEKEQLKVKSQGFSSTISGMNAKDFPAVPKKLEKNTIKLATEDFLEALSQISFATSIDESRPVLTGVLFIFQSVSSRGQLVMVATDGFRLSQKKISLKESVKKNKIILPKGALSELSKIAKEDEISFSFQEKDNQVIFGMNDVVLASRILEGEFPNFEKIIPKETKYRVFLDKQDFLKSVKLASVFARESANIIKFLVKKNSMQIVAESQTSGRQKTELEARVEGDSLPSGGFKINFNYRFIEDFLNVVKGEEVNLSFSETNAPGVFTDPKDPDFLHLIMPVKIQE